MSTSSSTLNDFRVLFWRRAVTAVAAVLLLWAVQPLHAAPWAPKPNVADDVGNWSSTTFHELQIRLNGFKGTYRNNVAGFAKNHHAQGIVRLPNKDVDGDGIDDRAYFAITQSSRINYGVATSSDGYWLVVETDADAYDAATDQVVATAGSDGRIVYEEHFMSDPSLASFEYGNGPQTISTAGDWNHPAKMATIDGVLLIAAQQAQLAGFTVIGNDPDAVLFYDVRDPVNPAYLGKLTSLQLGLPAKASNGRDVIASLDLAVFENGFYHLTVEKHNYICHESTDCFAKPIDMNKWAKVTANVLVADQVGQMFHSRELFAEVPAGGDPCYGSDGTRYNTPTTHAECASPGTYRAMFHVSNKDSVLPDGLLDGDGSPFSDAENEQDGIPVFSRIQYTNGNSTVLEISSVNDTPGKVTPIKNRFYSQLASDCQPTSGLYVSKQREPLIYCVSISSSEPIGCPGGEGGKCNRIWQNAAAADPGFGVIKFTDINGATVTYRGRGLHNIDLLSKPPWGPGRNANGTPRPGFVDWKATQITGIEVISGNWMLYPGANFWAAGGQQFYYYLRPGSYTLAGLSLADVGSFRVKPERGISLFEHGSFRGRMLNSIRSNPNLGRSCGDSYQVCAGLPRDDCTYDILGVDDCTYPRSFNDQASSIIVSSNNWAIWEHEAFGGQAVRNISKGSGPLPGLGGYKIPSGSILVKDETFNDNVTSVQAYWAYDGTSPCIPPLQPTVIYAPTFPQGAGRPLFSWQAVPNATQYQVVVLDAAGTVVRDELRYATRYMPATPLPPGDYRWRVQGVNKTASCDLPGLASALYPVTVPLPPVQLLIQHVSVDNNGLGAGTVAVSQAPLTQVGGNYYAPGTVVTLTATPSAQSEFVGWFGNAAGCGTALTCNLTIAATDTNVTAVFRPKPRLYLDTRGNGTAVATPQGSGCSSSGWCDIYSTGTAVTLTATPGPRAQFVRWAGDPDCSDGTVTMNQSMTCTAIFNTTDYLLTVSTYGSGNVVSTSPTGAINCGSDCIESYPAVSGQQTVLLTATEDPGSVFVRWYGDTDCWDEDENDGLPKVASVTVGAADVTCSAMFVNAGTEYALTVEKYGVGAGTVTATATPAANSSGIDCPLRACSQDYPVNTVVQLTATPVRGSVFAGWEGDADCVDGTVTMTNHHKCGARFTAKILLVDGSANGSSTGPRTDYISVLNSLQDTDYDEWSVRSPGSTGNPGGRAEPTTADLAPYSRIIWFTSDASTDVQFSPPAGPSPAAEASLGQYLDGGGCLLLSSPEYFRDRGLTSFAQTYLGVSAMTENVSAAATQVTGAGLLPGFSSLGPFTLVYDMATGANLDPLLNDTVVANKDTGTDVLFSYGAAGHAAVGRDNGIYRTAFLGFPFLALGSGNDRIEVMGTFLDHCLQIDRDDVFEINDDFQFATGQQGAVSLTDLRILPGTDDYFRWSADWNAQTQISISFDYASGDLALEVYDNTRQLLASAQSQNDDEAITLHVSAGQLYFIRVYGPNGASNGYSLDISQAGPSDLDGDGLGDLVDAIPNDPLEQFDVDGDFIGDNADIDNDNDGMPDSYEITHNLDPLLASDAFDDPDGDGFTNLEESLADTDPGDPDSTPTASAPTVFACDDNNACTLSSYILGDGCTHTPIPMCRASDGDLCFPIKTKSGTVSMICL